MYAPHPPPPPPPPHIIQNVYFTLHNFSQHSINANADYRGDLRVEQLQVLSLALLLCLFLKLSCPLSGLLQFTLKVSHLECVSVSV